MHQSSRDKAFKRLWVVLIHKLNQHKQSLLLHLKDVLTICFEVDEKIFNFEKTIRGVDAGSPYSLEYLPSKDIKGDYSADVRYGMLAGLKSSARTYLYATSTWW
jgi:hypothetical protein